MKLIINTLFVCGLLLIPTLSFSQTEDETYFEKANKLFKAEKWEQGKKVVDKGITESPLDSDLLMLLGKYYHIKGNNDLARFNLLKSIQLDPNNVDAKQILVNVELASKHYSSAICYVNELLEVNPYWKGLWRKKIELFKLQGNYEEANRLLKRIIQIYPEDKQLQEDYKYSLQNEINDLRKKSNKSEGIKKINELIKIDGKNPELYNEIINTYISSGDNENALIFINRAIEIFPNDSYYIKKKASVLADLGDHGSALSLLKSKMQSNPDLKSTYDQMLLNNARFQNQNDPYTLYGGIFAKNPKNKEALNYLLNTSLSRGYYSDAEQYILKAKKLFGENKELLHKELMLFRETGNKSKEIQVINKLYGRYPEEKDIQNMYLQSQFEIAKSHIYEGQKMEGIVPLLNIIKYKQNHFTEKSLQLVTDLYVGLGRFTDALKMNDTLIYLYPDNINNYFKKVTVLKEMKRYQEAINLYESILNNIEDEEERASYLYGYEELSLEYVKKLNEDGQAYKVMEILDCVLEHNDQNELVYRYAINNSFKLGHYNQAMHYSKKASSIYTNDVEFSGKIAESYYKLKKYNITNDLLDSLLPVYPHNNYLLNLKKDVIIDSAKILEKAKLGDDRINVANEGLKYNENSNEFKYYKGLGYQLNQNYDSAYYYQIHYVPSIDEKSDFEYHLMWLKHKTFKNQFAFFHLKSRLGEIDKINSISTFEYTRILNLKNVLIGRVNYSAREQGVGLLPQIEWSHTINKKYFIVSNASYGTRYFQKFAAKVNITRALKKDFDINLGMGYRVLPTVYSLVNVEFGITKHWENIVLNARVNVYTEKTLTFYNFLLDSKYFLFREKRSFVQALVSVGSIPEVAALDLGLYSKFDASNTMVGLGLQHMVSAKLTLGILGNWYNYKISTTSYQNLYNLYFQVYYSL